MAIWLLLFLTQIVIAFAMECPEGQMKHTFCCVPVWSCREGHYIKTCEREGAEDKCMKCRRGMENPFNSSSFDIKKCHKICKLTDSVSVSDNRCECDRSKGWFGENSLACQIAYGGCPVGKELTQKGTCERCTNFHYKNWHGYGLCRKHFNCSLLQMEEIEGNSTHANKCIKKGKKAFIAPTTTTSSTSTLFTTLASTTTRATTAGATATTKTSKKASSKHDSVLENLNASPTKSSQNLPVVGNQAPSDREIVRSSRIEGILIVVVAILCFLLLIIVCIGTVAYFRRRLKSSREVTIPNRPALPLPSTQNNHLPDTFAPPVYQSQRQTQPLLQQENPYLCMSNPQHSCVYALPASLHLNNNQNVNYLPNHSPVFDTVSTYGLNYIPSQNRPISPGSNPNNLGSQITLQSRNEHLYMTLPAERSESTSILTTLAPMTSPTTTTTSTTMTAASAVPAALPAVPHYHLESMSLENRKSTTENFYEFP